MHWTKQHLKLERELELKETVVVALEASKEVVVEVANNKEEAAVVMAMIAMLLFSPKTTLIPQSCNLKIFGSSNFMLHGVAIARLSSLSTTLLLRDLKAK